MGWDLTLSPKIVALAQQNGVGRSRSRMKKVYAAGSAGHSVLRPTQESDWGLGCQQDFTLNASTR